MLICFECSFTELVHVTSVHYCSLQLLALQREVPALATELIYHRKGQNSHLQTVYTTVAETSLEGTAKSVQGEKLALVSVQQNIRPHAQR